MVGELLLYETPAPLLVIKGHWRRHRWDTFPGFVSLIFPLFHPVKQSSISYAFRFARSATRRENESRRRKKVPTCFFFMATYYKQGGSAEIFHQVFLRVSFIALRAWIRASLALQNNSKKLKIEMCVKIHRGKYSSRRSRNANRASYAAFRVRGGLQFYWSKHGVYRLRRNHRLCAAFVLFVKRLQREHVTRGEVGKLNKLRCNRVSARVESRRLRRNVLFARNPSSIR